MVSAVRRAVLSLFGLGAVMVGAFVYECGLIVLIVLAKTVIYSYGNDCLINHEISGRWMVG